MANAEAISFGFLNSLRFSADTVKDIANIIISNYSTRPRFTEHEIQIKGEAAGTHDIVGMVRRGTKILDAIMYKHYGNSQDYRTIFQFEEAEVDDTINAQQQVVGLSMWLMVTFTRGEMRPDQTPLPRFATQMLGQGYEHQQHLARLISSATNITSWDSKLLLLADIRTLDTALVNRISQGVAGHKPLKFALHARSMMGPNDHSAVVAAMLEVADRKWRYLHPSVSDGKINEIAPKFTHTFMAQVCLDIPRIQVQILNQPEVTQRDRQQVNDIIARQTPGSVVLTPGQVERLVVKCYSHGEFIFGNDAPKPIPAHLANQVQVDRNARGYNWVNTDWWAASAVAQGGNPQPPVGQVPPAGGGVNQGPGELNR